MLCTAANAVVPKPCSKYHIFLSVCPQFFQILVFSVSCLSHQGVSIYPYARMKGLFLKWVAQLTQKLQPLDSILYAEHSTLLSDSVDIIVGLWFFLPSSVIRWNSHSTIKHYLTFLVKVTTTNRVHEKSSDGYFFGSYCVQIMLMPYFPLCQNWSSIVST